MGPVSDQFRKSPRAKWACYNVGDYFVTICTNQRIHYFGEIKNGEMCLSDVGRFLADELKHPEHHHPHIEVPVYVVMPNHVHAIIRINNVEDDASSRAPTCEERRSGMGQKNLRTPLLSTYIGSLKSSVTRYAHKNHISFSWQSRYHDHIIRDARDGNNIVEYIIGNIANWKKDCFFD